MASRLLLLARFVEIHDRRRPAAGQIPKPDHKRRINAVLASGPAGKAVREFALTTLTKRLWLVVRRLLLIEMGLSQELTAEALQLDHEWEWLCGRPHS